MPKTSFSKEQITRRLKGVEKPIHAQTLAESILRTTSEGSIAQRIAQANAVVKEMKKAGVSSFFAAEYAKIFTTPDAALSARKMLVERFTGEHGLTPRRAAKITDCIAFTSAKRGQECIFRLANMASAALGAGVDFPIVSDNIYYSSPEITPLQFAAKCQAESSKKAKTITASEVELVRRLSESISA